MPMRNIFAGGYNLLSSFGNCLQSLILLIFRLYWGYLFYRTGRGKLESHENVVEFFSGLGVPMPDFNAWFVGGVECFGGILLMLGFLARPVALMLTVNMLVAYLAVPGDREKLLGVLTDPAPFLAADPFFFLLTSALVLGFGPGKLSLDALLSRLFRGAR